ncbi:hypothetical protein AXG93_1962s1200 [Marchantia polymorpha subsp. ruderalis]|uniref:Uncharacterized protein n=1 Tax=Marchantia polymorpha subsp. ruderalis TaxID=1480154 RepID=A0A176WF52_MARPO|nr:hypothetical protein AXG93_1962s1200 [Marchantia polymorpha subsp. ruderalis]
MVPLRVPQVGLQAFQDELMAVKLNFLQWGWNWMCPAMVREWLREKNQSPRGYQPHREKWQVSDWEQVRFAELALAGTPIHRARILWKTTRQHAQEEKGGSINHLSPFLINVYRSMGTPPARLRADDEPRGARAPQKRKWDGDADVSQREVPTTPVRRRANNEPARPKQKARKLVLPVNTGRAAVSRDSPSSE